MSETFSATELRVLGCLLEKSVITPDQYPLTLNALVNACNQKSSREPVTNLSPGEVQGTARRLADRHLLVIEENFKSRVEKYQHRFCNTPFSDLQLDPPSYAILTLLFLRGPQTPGEIRARSPRLHAFATNEEVVATLKQMQRAERGPLVVMLERKPGRRDNEYQHTFCSEPVADIAANQDAPSGNVAPVSVPAGPEQIMARIEILEAELASLRERIGK